MIVSHPFTGRAPWRYVEDGELVVTTIVSTADDDERLSFIVRGNHRGAHTELWLTAEDAAGLRDLLGAALGRTPALLAAGATEVC